MHDKRTALARDIRKEIQKVFGGKVFRTVITKSVRLEEPGVQGIDFYLRAGFGGRDRLLQPVRGGHGTCRNADYLTRCGCGTTSTMWRRWRRPPGRLWGACADRPADPNPDQPRQVMGDLSELIASITEKGIIEPLIVRQRGPRLQIMRENAAITRGPGGTPGLPVIERMASDAEVLELALIENLQRKDLTAFEESEALQPFAQVPLHPRGHGAEARKSRTSI